jgi:hypothetical protein
MKDLKITDVQIIPIQPKAGHIGFVNFVLQNAMRISSVAIFTSLKNIGDYRLVWPAKKVNERLIYYSLPVNKGIQKYILEVLTPEIKKIFKDL